MRHIPQKTLTWLFAIAGITALFLVVKIGLITPGMTEADAAPASQGTTKNVDERRLLIESIVAIIQNYYVDYDRADNLLILRTIAQNLSDVPGIKVELNEKSINFDIDQDHLELALSDPLSYEQLFHHIDSVISSIDRAGKRHSLNALRRQKRLSGTELVMNALLSGLDPHSALLSPEAYLELRQGTEGAFGGLGVLVSMRDELLTVVKPLPRSPAIRAGIQKNDKILKINDVSTFGLTLDDLVEHMRGNPGTKVNLSIMRQNSTLPERLALTREIIQVDSVEVIPHPDKKGILHLTIDTFSSKTSREVLNAIKAFRAKNQGQLGGLVLDLRSNPGGLLDQAVQVADLFLESGVIVSTSGRREEVEMAGAGYDEIEFPIVVLINEDSASASEIVAGALQDHERAIVIGQPSFGKGSVQTVFELPGGRALKLTIARYYTPKGRSIQNEGILPNVWMQPMFKKPENLNLLGDYRYNNENFLQNHLTAITKQTQAPRLVPTTFSGFYEQQEKKTGNEKMKDLEFELAATIIKKSMDTYGYRLPKTVRRSNHWLALASKEINDYLGAISRPMVSWLDKNYQVKWDGRASNESMPNTVSFQVTEPSRTYFPGESFELPYTIDNPSRSTVDRLSIYLTGLSNGLETKEILVGRLGAGEKRQGIIKGKVPSLWEAGQYKMTVGLAKDALPTNMNQYLKIDVLDKKLPELSANFQIVEEFGGKVNGMLDSGETVKVKITVRNNGKEPVQKIKFDLRNLAGAQIKLKTPNDQLSLSRMEPGGVHSFLIDVIANKSLAVDEVLIGVMGDSADLRKPLRESLAVLAVPDMDARKSLQEIAH